MKKINAKLYALCNNEGILLADGMGRAHIYFGEDNAKRVRDTIPNRDNMKIMILKVGDLAFHATEDEVNEMKFSNWISNVKPTDFEQ